MSLRAVIGVTRLAQFHADGLTAFDASPGGLLNAFAPWLGFALVGFVVVLAAGPAEEAVVGLLTSLVGILAPAVLSHALAARWGRGERWLRYAVAYTWCQWAMPPALLLALLGAGLLIAAGLPNAVAEPLAALAVLSYALALHGFLAWHALSVSRARAAAMVLAVTLGTVALVVLPGLVDLAINPPADSAADGAG